MFGRHSRKPSPTPVALRDTLFGNMPLDRWSAETAAVPVDGSFSPKVRLNPLYGSPVLLMIERSLA
jgi:hypothetical protein